jgi:hypothetical protein
MSAKRRTVWIAVTVLAWWGFIAWRMWLDMRRDPGPTGLPGDLENFHNRPGDLSQVLTMTVVELLFVLVILRPWSYQRSWGRSLAALLLLTPWTLFYLLILIHSGGIMVLHSL